MRMAASCSMCCGSWRRGKTRPDTKRAPEETGPFVSAMDCTGTPGEGVLHSYAIFCRSHLVPGVRIHIIRRAPVKFVPLTQFAANIETQGDHSERYRTPANGLQGNSRFVLFPKTRYNNHFSLLSRPKKPFLEWLHAVMIAHFAVIVRIGSDPYLIQCSVRFDVTSALFALPEENWPQSNWPQAHADAPQ